MSDTPPACFACAQASLPVSSLAVVKTDDIALCTTHWNWWLFRFLNSDDEPPCGAHLITEGEPK